MTAEKIFFVPVERTAEGGKRLKIRGGIYGPFTDMDHVGKYIKKHHGEDSAPKEIVILGGNIINTEEYFGTPEEEPKQEITPTG